MTSNKKTYEAMFLLDAGNPDFQAACEPIRALLDRNEAEVLAIKPWEDRRLAYEIRGRRRGLYVLTYFSANPQRIVEIEHDCRLDERVLRVLILRREHLGEEELNAETPASIAARRQARPPATSDADEAQAPAPVQPDEAATASPLDDQVKPDQVAVPAEAPSAEPDEDPDQNSNADERNAPNQGE